MNFTLSNTNFHYKILVFHIKTVWFGYQLSPFILCEFNFFKQRKQGTSNGKLVSKCRKTSSSKLLATTQDLESCWPLSFQYQNFSHISMTIMTSKNQIFIIVCHLPVDLYKGVLLHALQTKASLLLVAIYQV